MTISVPSLEQLRTRSSAKWRTYPDDVLPLFVAELDFALAAPIAEALHDSIRRSDTGYASGDAELPEAFSRFAAERWGWSVDIQHVRSTADVSMGIVECLRRVTETGDRVVITPPVYPPFFDLVRESGAAVVAVPLRDSDASDHSAWSLDLDAIEAAFRDGAKAMVLCNPHNPLGHPHPRSELEELARIADRYGVTIVSDEIHAPLTHSDGDSVPYLTVSQEARDHGIAITSASKAFNLAGLKCAVMVTASARMRAVVSGMYQEVFWRTSHLGAIASVAAFRYGSAWLDDAIATLEGNRSLLTRLLAEKLPGVAYREPAASYLAWLDFRALGLGDNPAERLLSDARVALSPGPDFGGQGTGFARLNFGCSPEVLTEAIERIAAATIGSHDRQ
ncbi:aminotransferase class I/II-fold pyridoxal phosphate-dependent enzyme [Salinibacterium sp. dk2585]|uniref:MalY/PatB family protein n=1 Tax=unclassified Salinibacterium TaxID=2632331 RepID=UPI0011C24E46|nr:MULTISPECIES: aminotransferase class I/II-fold pyridoxal phosphate-dependent enzyme [unclassified Salinibacterium]QEE61454.1 aminotransferase class I/II-fold pyridoxal phosphate-dependent enzyme [Salinibacterium sp. dk2585]TXK54131.1 aminotransferase class I/II-fold pyridoxal phosphate-dependent enzyme [Salinibacterium sp. dk5596]